jgi:hypothetical protein
MITCKHCDWTRQPREPKWSAADYWSMVDHAERHGYIYTGYNHEAMWESYLAMPEEMMLQEAEPRERRDDEPF